MAHEFAEAILPYERSLFLFLNDLHTSYLDIFMWIYSSKFTWIPLAVVCTVIFIYKMKWKEALLLVLCAALLGTLCDQLSAAVIKPIFERLRPTHHVDFKDYVHIVLGYRGGRYGFISAHAANGFGIAVFSSLLFRYRYYTITIFLWALLTCYSRIYLGVHFISDVIGGMLVGSIIGLLVYKIYLLLRQYLLKVPQKEVKRPVLSPLRAKIMISTISIIFVSIILYSMSFLKMIKDIDKI